MAGPRIATRLGALVALRIAQPVRFRVKQRVQRLLDRPAHDPVEMSFDPLVIDPDHIVERSRNRSILVHGGFLLLALVADLAITRRARVGAASLQSIVRKKPYVIRSPARGVQVGSILAGDHSLVQICDYK